MSTLSPPSYSPPHLALLLFQNQVILPLLLKVSTLPQSLLPHRVGAGRELDPHQTRWSAGGRHQRRCVPPTPTSALGLGDKTRGEWKLPGFLLAQGDLFGEIVKELASLHPVGAEGRTLAVSQACPLLTLAPGSRLPDVLQARVAVPWGERSHQEGLEEQCGRQEVG